MRYTIAFLSAFVCFSAESSAQTYGLDNTNPEVFSKFRIPKTDLSALWFNAGMDYSSNKYSVLGQGAPNSSSFVSNLYADFSPQYYLLEESDNRYLSLSVDATGSIQNQYNKSEGTYFPVGYAKRSDNIVNLNVSGTYRDYAASSDLFLSVGSTDQFNLNAQYGSSSTNLYTASYYATKNQTYDFSFGVGFGKMRNVTSVVSAIRFQERLKQLNLLNGDLSEKTIEDLAQQFYREGYYGDVHVRPDKFFWQDVQKTLANDGVSLAGLNQYADSYIREVPNELRFMREEGVVAGLNLQFEYENTFSTYDPGSYVLTENLFTMANAYIEYSHQLNLNSQLSFGLNLSGGPNIVKDSPVTQQYITDANIGYDYELTDRIVTSATNTFGIVFQNFGKQSKALSNELDLSVNYFVEDNISLGALYRWDYSDLKNVITAYPVHTTRSINMVSVDLTYYINRGFLYK